MEWIGTAQKAAEIYNGLTTFTNSRDNVELPYEPAFRNKKQPLRLFLRWQDAYTKASGNSQYTQWTWNLPQPIRDYATVKLISIDYNRAYFTSPGKYICLQISELQGGRPQTSLDEIGGKSCNPTFIVPARSSLPEYSNPVYEDTVTCKELYISTMSVILGDETFAPLVFGSATGTYYCNVELLFE